MIALLKKQCLITFSLLVLTACSSTPLKYQLDPEINNLNQFNPSIKIVAVSVIDARSTESGGTTRGAAISGPKDEATILTKSLISILKDNGMKIISKPLLADLSIKMEINKFNVKLKEETFKSIITANSKLTVTLHKHSQQWSKIVKASRVQEVANPVNSLDVTGVMTQMLSKQLSGIFSDPQLKQFVNSKE